MRTNTVAVQKWHPQIAAFPADLVVNPAVCVGIIACIRLEMIDALGLGRQRVVLAI